MEYRHSPVLLAETIESLKIKPDGLYADCTAGGGGHSLEILKRLSPEGRLIAIDRDPDAVGVLCGRLGAFPNVRIVRDTFDNIRSILNGRQADGILADLGVSSHQLDTPERGFSFHIDAPLDMRMSREGVSAAELVNSLSEAGLCRILRDYGEERYAAGIARNIVRQREKRPILTTFELCEVVRRSLPQRALGGAHPARRTFQALRIEVNGELNGLGTALSEMFRCLKVGGVLSVISFHSLEDRIVKKCFASLCEGCICPRDFPVCVCGRRPRGKLNIRSLCPSDEELSENPRARSAKLRSIEKLRDD